MMEQVVLSTHGTEQALYDVGKFASEIILLFISAVLTYIAYYMRVTSEKADKVYRVLFGLDEIEDDGLVVKVEEHREILKEEGLWPPKDDSKTNIQQLKKRIEELEDDG